METSNKHQQVAANGDTATAASGLIALADPAHAGQARDPNNAQEINHAGQKIPQGRLLLKVHEVAQVLGVSTASIRRLIARGELKANRKLRHVLIPRTEIERFATGGAQ